MQRGEGRVRFSQAEEGRDRGTEGLIRRNFFSNRCKLCRRKRKRFYWFSKILGWFLFFERIVFWEVFKLRVYFNFGIFVGDF